MSRQRERWLIPLARLKAFLVQSRNSDLCNKLPGSYRTDHSNANTKVFCVSNLFYRDHRYERTQTDLAYLHLSGIIRLRQHCVSIVSANQHKEASAFINTDVPKLLTDSSLWVQSGEDTLDGERRAAVTRTLDCIERQLRAVSRHRNSKPIMASTLLNFTVDTH